MESLSEKLYTPIPIKDLNGIIQKWDSFKFHVGQGSVCALDHRGAILVANYDYLGWKKRPNQSSQVYLLPEGGSLRLTFTKSLCFITSISWSSYCLNVKKNPILRGFIQPFDGLIGGEIPCHELNGINSQSVRAWLASASKAWPKFIKLPQP